MELQLRNSSMPTRQTMTLRGRCMNTKRHILLYSSVAYSMMLSLGVLSYLHHYDSLRRVSSSDSDPRLSHQKGIPGWTYRYSYLLRNLSIEFTSYSHTKDEISAKRPEESVDIVHDGYRNLFNQPLKLSCSSCALVASSGHLLNTSAGKEIDSTPCVFRMNDAPVLGYENDVGLRTTVRSIGHVNLIKSFEKNNASIHEIFDDNRTRTEIVLINWMNDADVGDVLTNKDYRFAVLLAHLYPHVRFYTFTSKKMNNTQELFKNETGVYSFDANTWISTGLFTMVAAMDICKEITVYGMAHEDLCIKPEKKMRQIPYHYYEPDARKECQYFKVSEKKLTAGHLLITEKAIFSNWAARSGKIQFKYPTWPVKNATSRIDYTPYFQALELEKRKKKKEDEETDIQEDEVEENEKNEEETKQEKEENNSMKKEKVEEKEEEKPTDEEETKQDEEENNSMKKEKMEENEEEKEKENASKEEKTRYEEVEIEAGQEKTERRKEDDEEKGVREDEEKNNEKDEEKTKHEVEENSSLKKEKVEVKEEEKAKENANREEKTRNEEGKTTEAGKEKTKKRKPKNEKRENKK